MGKGQERGEVGRRGEGEQKWAREGEREGSGEVGR